MFVAHAGHLLIDVPLFLGPPLLLAAALWAAVRRERRRGTPDSSDRAKR
jgi:hypothetical protein